MLRWLKCRCWSIYQKGMMVYECKMRLLVKKAQREIRRSIIKVIHTKDSASDEIMTYIIRWFNDANEDE